MCVFINITSHHNTLVIRQKGESQDGCFKKTKHVKFPEKTNISYPWYVNVRKNVRFSENMVCFVFLKHRFAIRPFALLPTNRTVVLGWSFHNLRRFFNFSAVFLQGTQFFKTMMGKRNKRKIFFSLKLRNIRQ